jgi:hypothetical protein
MMFLGIFIASVISLFAIIAVSREYFMYSFFAFIKQLHSKFSRRHQRPIPLRQLSRFIAALIVVLRLVLPLVVRGHGLSLVRNISV